LRLRPITSDEAPIVRHAVFVKNGQPVAPRVDERSKDLSPAEYDAYLARLLAGVRADSTRRDGVHKILIRIHGGVNRLSTSLDVSLAMWDSIAADRRAGYYPIFVNWESGLSSAYLEHLVNIRRGERYPTFSLRGAPLVPVYLATDFGQAIIRAPINATAQFRLFTHGITENNQEAIGLGAPPPLERESAFGRLMGEDNDQHRKAQRREISLVEAQSAAIGARRRRDENPLLAHGGELSISRFAYHRSAWEATRHIGMGAAYSIPPNVYLWGYQRITKKGSGWSYGPSWLRVVGWIPLKPVAMVVIDALGTPAWDNMRRRTQTMFRPSALRDEQDSIDGYVPPSGAVARLFDALDTLVKYDRRTRYEFTIIAHSMGAIVANEIMRTHDDLPIRNIVFMAPAVSTREFERGVLPYLERHEETEFYLLALHPLAERREAHLLRIAPYGSALEWVDSYFAHPDTDLDMMIGKYDTAVQASVVFPPSVRGRIHIKGFGYNDGSGCGTGDNLPNQHDQFNDPSVPFWREAFWHPGVAGCEEIKRRQLAGAEHRLNR
jgi:hypothetical protein